MICLKTLRGGHALERTDTNNISGLFPLNLTAKRTACLLSRQGATDRICYKKEQKIPIG